ncbi:MAG: dihydropteroate synthase-like protein [Methanomicrobiales archaeon]|nr:dihydropteroate synthase-like protein [Methanomicrobiales archaeon]
MRILLPTGETTERMVRDAAKGLDAEVVVTGSVASFLTPDQLRVLLRKDHYGMVIVSGMCTASFLEVEAETGIPIFRGPRHAADLSLILPHLNEIELSRSVPADDFLVARHREEACRTLVDKEEKAGCDYLIRGIKIGGGSRMKVLAEIMDAHLQTALPAAVDRFFSNGADIVDLGFGFDATPDDVRRCYEELAEIDGPLALDSMEPALIRAGLFRADIVLSLDEKNISQIGPEIARQGCAAVILPGERGLDANIVAAEAIGISCLIADPLLMPVGSGLSSSLARFRPLLHPLFFGAGNVVELFDADSIGMNALLAGIAHELGASVIFTSEHSDKTRGSVGEMRRATEMMALVGSRPYPKDLGIDLLVLKEKRCRREPPLSYETVTEVSPAPSQVTYDPRGNFRIGIEGDQIVAVINGRAIRGKDWVDIFYTILLQEDVSLLDHAAYLGAELFKAELAIRFGRSFEQDGPF